MKRFAARRHFLGDVIKDAGAVAVGASGTLTTALSNAQAIGADSPAWLKAPGAPFRAYGQPSKHEAKVA